jgi:hypothetical protein
MSIAIKQRGVSRIKKRRQPSTQVVRASSRKVRQKTRRTATAVIATGSLLFLVSAFVSYIFIAISGNMLAESQRAKAAKLEAPLTESRISLKRSATAVAESELTVLDTWIREHGFRIPGYDPQGSRKATKPGGSPYAVRN